MNEIREFVLKHLRLAVMGCVDWSFDPEGIMYSTYFAEREAYVKMLKDIGLPYTDILDIEAQIVREYAASRA